MRPEDEQISTHRFKSMTSLKNIKINLTFADLHK